MAACTPSLGGTRTLGHNPGLLGQCVEWSKKTPWKRWGLAVIVNLGAAVVGALAFGAWQRFQSSQSAANVPSKSEGFYELVDDVGFIPRANAQMTARAEVEGRTIYDVVYTTGPDHFRVVPQATETPDACVLLFGDSFTFGDGVGDDETYAAQIVKQSGRRVAAQNFAVSGWGPHQFLAGLQSGRFSASGPVQANGCRILDGTLADLARKRRDESMGHARAALPAGPRWTTGPGRHPWRSRSLQLAAMDRLESDQQRGGVEACDSRGRGGHERAQAALSRHSDAFHLIPRRGPGVRRTPV